MPRPPSQLIETSLGAVEFARHDTGAAVIISHSTGGGYDQGLMIARLLDGFQAIAVSRAGYLRTPLTTGQSHPRGSARMPDIRSQTGIAVLQAFLTRAYRKTRIHLKKSGSR